MARLFNEERKEIWRGIRVVLALFALEFVNDRVRSSPFLDNFAHAHQFDLEYVKIIFGIIAVIICALILVLFEVLLRRNEVRIVRNLSRLKIFEGAWAQKSSIEERPYSLSVIEFSEARGRWEYFGIGFSDKFEPAAEWETQSLFYDESSHEWFFGGAAFLRSYSAQMHEFPQTGGKGSVTPILLLRSSAATRVEGLVADFDVGQSHGPFRITLFRVPEKHKNEFSDAAALLALKPEKVKEILSDSGVPVT